MINTDMRNFDYFLYGENDDYGQPTLSEKQGTVKISINIASQNIQENINYSGCSYVGLTHEVITDKYVIEYEGEKLKVLYVNPKGRYKQIFLGRM